LNAELFGEKTMRSKKHKRKKIYRAILLSVISIVSVIAVMSIIKLTQTDSSYELKISDSYANGIESEVTVDVSVNKLGDSIYPAASFVIDFDKSKLELLSLNEGNLLIASQNGFDLPTWNVNIENANKSGEIKVMYLDITGGTEAFTGKLSDNGSIVFRLKFRVRGSCREGEICKITVKDAVFAANDESDSISMTTGVLKVKNGSIIVGESK